MKQLITNSLSTSRAQFGTAYLRALICIIILLSASAKISANESVVLVFGDSISAGIYVPSTTTGFCEPGDSNCPACADGEFCNGIGAGATEFALPDLNLSALLNGSRRTTTVVNWGHGGTSSGPSSTQEATFNNGLSRISANLQSTINQYPADKYFVLIMYGTNDRGQGVSSTDTGFNISQMIKKVTAVDAIPVVGSIPPQTNDSVSYRNTQIKLAAQNKSVAFVDIHDAISTSLLYDGIHPNLDGYNIIAETWFDGFLTKAIEQEAPIISPIIYLLLDDG
ncbi:MAG: lysophospholipase L1-like esterase [Arenicella sp.]|jgi:lysophospholipase L1-like esterase